MDIGNFKKDSDLAHDLSQHKKNALEKLHSRQIVAYQGKIFRANPETINLVQSFKAHNKQFFMLDTNGNPAHITNPEEFLQLLMQRNQEALNTYHQLFEDLKQKRF